MNILSFYRVSDINMLLNINMSEILLFRLVLSIYNNKKLVLSVYIYIDTHTHIMCVRYAHL